MDENKDLLSRTKENTAYSLHIREEGEKKTIGVSMEKKNLKKEEISISLEDLRWINYKEINYPSITINFLLRGGQLYTTELWQANNNVALSL